MAKATKEQIAWFQELWREIMGDVLDADMAQKWFEKFPDTTKEEMRKMLEIVNSPEVRAPMEARAREERRRARQAELAARRAQVKNPAAMNIMILSYAYTSGWYAATLMERGHLVTMFGGGLVSNLFEQVEDYDGCLLLGTEPELLDFADVFEAKAKKVWHELTDIPRDRDRPQW